MKSGKIGFLSHFSCGAWNVLSFEWGACPPRAVRTPGYLVADLTHLYLALSLAALRLIVGLLEFCAQGHCQCAGSGVTRDCRHTDCPFCWCACSVVPLDFTDKTKLKDSDVQGADGRALEPRMRSLSE